VFQKFKDLSEKYIDRLRAVQKTTELFDPLQQINTDETVTLQKLRRENESGCAKVGISYETLYAAHKQLAEEFVNLTEENKTILTLSATL
jgi:hypothetical protein